MISQTSFLSVNLNVLVDLMRIRAETVLSQNFEIDYSQFLVLHTINRLDSPYQSEISQCINYTPAGVSKIIDKLEQLQFVTKVVDKKNRRANHLTLTKSGKVTIDKALILLEKEFDSLISPQDKATMSKITASLITKLI
jgi:DNA-binding MarR family transcriptional regulator